MFQYFSLYFIFLLFCSLVFGLFEQCNHVVDLKAGQKIYINSPYYPNKYPAGTSCRYTVRAPLDHELNFKCNLQLESPSSATRCTNEIFYFNREGSELLSGSEYFCGSGSFERTSFLNRAVISYISTTTTYIRNIPKPGTKTATTTTTTTTTRSPASSIKISTPAATTTTTNKWQYTYPTTATKTTITRRTTTKRPRIKTTTTTPATTLASVLETAYEKTEIGVSNAFAYVMALLSNNNYNNYYYINNNDKNNNNDDDDNNNNNIYMHTNTVASSAATTATEDLTSNLPSITWRNSSSNTHPISNPIETMPTTTTSNFNTTPHILAYSTNDKYTNTISKNTTKKRASKIITNHPNSKGDFIGAGGGNGIASGLGAGFGGGGGLFSCLVEVIEPQCECGWSMSVKVAGEAHVASVNEFPSMAGVLTVRYNKIFCGAAIIHHRYLLSAAHCFITPATNRSDLIRVVVGEHDFSTVFESLYTRYYDIDEIIPHEHFRTTASAVRHDIALLRTRTSIEWNRSVGPACLPFRSVTGTDGGRKPPLPGQRLDTAGWGTTSFGGAQSTQLLKTTLDVISNEQCKRQIYSLPSGTFCTYTPGRDTCQYDSGGALYRREEYLFAVGIVSYGFACATQQPSVNTRVASYMKWIKSKTPEVRYCIK